ncbi:MAG: DUF72 domain-containing protein [Acidobacteriota bacterium]|nr:DUF72 domain-containing protein [Acidobacteriota bacterium]
MDEDSQLSLFSTGAPPRKEFRPSAFAERLEREIAETAAIAARVRKNVRFGTSSWSFPGWAGIVYSRRAPASELAKEGLVEYARHPLLNTVGIDRGFYAPISPEDLRRYAGQLPAAFPCCTKAPESVTGAVLSAPGTPRGGGPRPPNPGFLDPRRFEEEMLGPFRAAFAEHAGPFLLQFPPAPAEARLAPREFAERLDRFLGELPREFRYAVELRDPTLLTGEYGRVLASRGAAHVYNCATAMPMPAEQAERIPAAAADFVVVRLLLRPGTRYDDRREDFLPFDRIVDPNPEMRRQTVELARAASGRDVFVLVNNKAEGCAPATIRALAEQLASEAESGPVST